MKLPRAALQLCLLAGASALAGASSANAIGDPAECESTVPYSYDSGEATSVATDVSLPAAPWMQLDLSGSALHPDATLRLVGRASSQELTADALAANGFSAVFDGNSVALELVTANGGGGPFRGSGGGRASRVRIAALNVGLCAPPKVDDSICGLEDDRTLSYDVRQGRIG